MSSNPRPSMRLPRSRTFFRTVSISRQSSIARNSSSVISGNFAARSAFIAAVVSLTASWRASLPGIVRTSANFSPKPARAASSRSLRHASPSTTFFSALPSLARSSFWMATIFETHSWPNLRAARKSASGISLAPPSIMRKRSAVPE